MAGKDLKVNVIFDAKTKQLDKAFKQINKMQSQLNRQAVAQNRITGAVNKTNKAYKKSGSIVDGLTKKVNRLASAYLGVMGAKVAFNASDTITRAENKLNNLNGGDTAATQKQLDQMFASAQKVRMGYGDMMDNVSKSMMLAGDAFGGNIDNAIRFQEVMAEAYSVGGASAAEMSSSMYQMIQALGSGILQGDELRSVREGAPLAYKEIEKLAQSIYGADKNLKDMASDGLITSDIVVRAMLQAGDKMDDAFAKTEMTFAQAWTSMKNIALKSFEPVLQKMNDLLNSDVGRAIVDGIGTAIQIVAGSLLWVFGILETAFNFIQTNWATISKVLGTMAIVIASIVIPMFLKWLFAVVAATVATLAGVWADVAAFIALAHAEGLAATMAGLFGITINWALLLIIVAIAAVLIAVLWLSDSFADACGNIVGGVFWLGATLWNIFTGVINGIVQFLWTRFVEPVIRIIEYIYNAFNGGFDGLRGAVRNLLSQMLSWLMSFAKVATKIIDAVFGTELTAGINNLQARLDREGTTENYVSFNKEAPDFLRRTSAVAAFESGYGYGEQFGNWATDKVGGIRDKLSNTLNLGGLPTDSIAPDLDSIKGDTAKIADSVELTEEDLAYLKDIAHKEWKKEFTTANIQVDMTNNNNVNKDFDLNSLAIGLRNLVEEEMFAVANGVYV